MDRRKLGVVAGTLCVGAILAMWVWIFAGGPEPNTDSDLTDPELAATAEAVCAPILDDVLALPPAFEADSPEDRAVVLAEANELLRAQVRDLRAEVDPETAKDRSLVGQWLDDWDAYLDARDDHADMLASGEDGPLGVPADGARPIDKRMTDFARYNGMPSCAPPGDV